MTRMDVMKIIKPSFIIPAFISLMLMYIIFSLSAQPAETSSELSGGVTETFARFIFFDFDSIDEQQQTTIVEGLHGFVRKAAHFSVYFLLGISVYMTMRSVLKILKKQLIFAASVCLAYAALDEFHQLFIPERSGSITDVLIDISGAVCGMGVAMLVLSAVFYMKNIKK